MPHDLLTDRADAGAAAGAEARAALAGTWHLAVLRGPDAGVVLALPDGGERVVGRGGALMDPYVSREHLRLRATARGVSVLDAPGANGARWYGLRSLLRASGRRALRPPQRWPPGSRLRVGDTLLELRRRPEDLTVPRPLGPRAGRGRARLGALLVLLALLVAVGVVVASHRAGYGGRSLMLLPLLLMGLMRLSTVGLPVGKGTGRCGWRRRRPDPAGLLLAVARRAHAVVPAAQAEDGPRAWCGRRGRRTAVSLEAGDALALTGSGALEALRWWTAQVAACGGVGLHVEDAGVHLVWGTGATKSEALLASSGACGPPVAASRVRAVPGSRGWRRDARRLSFTWWQAVTHMAGVGRPGATAADRADNGRALPRRAGLEEVLCEIDRERVRRAWRRPAPGLKAVLGVGANGPVSTDLVADGPHALLAGTTGSGKSELLTSWLLQLAAGHPPHRLSLVLIDYKGGAAFGRLTRLPHTAGVLTDLDHAMTSRALSSLSAEVRRRERVLARHGAADVAAVAEEERPSRLLIVVDEFAALATSHPEVLDALIRVAAQGRSLGIHLVLATQRPAGVVSAAVRANTALRVCLRVLDGADSRDVLGHEEAARLDPAPGRLLVAGSRREGPLQALYAGEAGQVARLVEELRAAATGSPGAWCPWAPPLPARVTRAEARARGATQNDAVLVGGPHAEARARGATGPEAGPGVLLAVTDLPEEQAQGTWSWDPGEALLVLGTAGSGRSTTVTSAAVGALAAGLEVHVCGSPGPWVGQAWTGLGTVVGTEDPRRLVRLWSLAAAGALGGVLVLDGAEELVAAVEEVLGPAEGAALLDAVRRGCALSGAGLVVSASLGSSGARWALPLRTRIVLGADDAARAAMAGVERGRLCGRGPGRGLLVVGHSTLDCQVVLADEDIGAQEIDRQNTCTAAGAPPVRLAPLPLSAVPRPGAWAVGGDDATPLGVPDGPVLVVGPHGSGRTTALHSLSRALAESTGETPLVVDNLDLAGPQELASVDEALATGARVLASATTERAVGAYRGALADLRARAAVVVLWPAFGPAAQVAGMSVRAACDPRHPTTPGRGVLVSRGEVTALQVAAGHDRGQDSTRKV
ncbi:MULTISPECIES: FtsK/SpoIIIE domain-containing protein [Actinomyces]|uniref:Cell division protein FtsK n=1 Tax=Actinomyces respiraculi TaxID=2744574 RepID=A0A7T0LLL9_9ACTO|nr:MULTISPECIES: FHA domain-containing protein [Actinomyces]QPL06044.1 cell division protein FtsK [Actinomyces respiraculi]